MPSRLFDCTANSVPLADGQGQDGTVGAGAARADLYGNCMLPKG
jgi:hypothetical protein